MTKEDAVKEVMTAVNALGFNFNIDKTLSDVLDRYAMAIVEESTPVLFIPKCGHSATLPDHEDPCLMYAKGYNACRAAVIAKAKELTK